MEQLNIFSDFSKYDSFNKPLADRIRPRNFEEFVGQKHLIDKGKILRQMIDSDNIGSMIFYGPPGVGKTTLASIIADMTSATYIKLSAIDTGVKELRELMKKAENDRLFGKKTIVFIDEIHRFNKAQQDIFLPYVEKGSIILIGATTENPSFEVNKALLSRAKVFVLKEIDIDDISAHLKKVLEDTRAFPDKKIFIEDDTIYAIAKYSSGDLRTALNTLELLVNNSHLEGMEVHIKKKDFLDLFNKTSIFYDKNGEEHYNLISALHKSMRTSDPDASVYWLSRMLEAGENPLYIARRIIQFASEDIGLADNNALQLAISAYNACHYMGLPDCDLALTQAVIYMALAPKSDSVYIARLRAKKDILEKVNEPVPLHLRNASTSLMKELSYGKDYKHAHNFDEAISDMQALPNNLIGSIYYEPKEVGKEKYFKERLEYIKLKKQEFKDRNK